MRYERLTALNREFHARVHTPGASVRHARIVDELLLSPVLRVTHARDVTNVTYPTARADLRALERLGIVQELPDSGPITYACSPIID